MSRLADRALLESLAFFYRRFGFLPGRLLDWAGMDLFSGGSRSERWAGLGVLPARGRDFPYWLLLNMASAHQRYAYLTGARRERHIARHLARELKPGDTFIDIGANIGMYTLQAAHLVGPRGRCIAVEASPPIFAILQGHLALNRVAHARAINVAAGAAPGEATIRGATEESDDGHLRPGPCAEIETARVKIETADAILADVPADARGICKIDVEGYEWEVVRGMERFLRSHPAMRYCVEISDAWLRQCSGAGAEELAKKFAEFGMERRLLDRKSCRPVPLPAGFDEFAYDAIFARPS